MLKHKTISVFLSVLFVFCSVFSFALPEAAGSMQQADEIDIPVFSADDTGNYEIPENEAMDLLRDMKCGWNLGNTFDAFSGYDSYVKGTQMEMSWVGARTSRKLLQAIKDAGFNTVRIPVSWHNHMDENLVIDNLWLNRVRQVADWAVNLGLYVIVNVHHDNDVKYFYPDSAHYEQSELYLSAVWQQMADAFADFDEHCILESMNEPRLVGHTNEWRLLESSQDCRDAAECINKLNQKFVNIVRSSGGNNATRYLAVPGYDASPEGAVSSLFRMPEDTADNRIIVEVHAYRPYPFALDLNSGDRTFNLQKDYSKKQDITGFMDNLYKKFISKGIPVIIDEFGALDKNGNLQDRVNCVAFYTASASARGMTCCLWDNHVFEGDNEIFGIIDRHTRNWVYPEIALAILSNCMFNR